jgi:hypothetical protein
VGKRMNEIGLFAESIAVVVVVVVVVVVAAAADHHSAQSSCFVNPAVGPVWTSLLSPAWAQQEVLHFPILVVVALVGRSRCYCPIHIAVAFVDRSRKNSWSARGRSHLETVLASCLNK